MKYAEKLWSPEIINRQRFFDSVAGIWEQEHTESQDTTKLLSLIRRFNLQPGQAVLDGGCGTGRLVPFILRDIGPAGRLVAVDISENMLAIARQKYSAPNLLFLQADVATLKITSYFDRLICFCLLPHLPDKLPALKAFWRYLKSDGQLIVAHSSSREEVNSYHAHLPEPICYDQLPDHQRMMELMRAAHFKILEFEESDIYFLRAVPEDKK